jgi:hypothetical protein
VDRTRTQCSMRTARIDRQSCMRSSHAPRTRNLEPRVRQHRKTESRKTDSSGTVCRKTPSTAGAACRSLTTQHGKVHFRFLPCRVSVARCFNTHAAPRLHGRNHVLLLSCSSCAVLDFNSSAAQSLRGSRPHRPAPCRPYAADGC